MAATATPAIPAKKELMSFRLIHGKHYEKRLDEKGEIILDSQGLPELIEYRAGQVVKSYTDLVKKYNGKHPSQIKFRRSNKAEEQDYEDEQSMLNPKASGDGDIFASMSDRDLRQLAEDNKVTIPGTVKTHQQLAEFVRKAVS